MLIRLFLFYLLLGTIPSTLSAKINPLNGQHLRILVQEFPVSFQTQRNATGHIIQFDGVEKHLIEVLSQMLNFSYSYLPIIALLPDDMPSVRGAISYLVDNEADYYMASSLATAYRFPKVDYPAAWYYGSFSTLLPYPKVTVNLAASFKTFSYEVWITMSISAFAIVLYLKLNRGNHSNHRKRKIETNDAKAKRLVVSNDDHIILDVFGNLVSQGHRDFAKRLTIRIAGGAWCCACFFLVQIYCCNLTSHLTSPNQKTLVNSFFEIGDTPGVSLTVDRGYAIDKMIQIAESTYVKNFVDKLKKDDRLITCNFTPDCMKHVKSGSAVYSAPTNSLSLIMAADLKNSSSCHYTRTKETFWPVPVYSYLRKNSPYTETMSKGTLRLQEAGLINEWHKWYVPSATKCMKVNERNRMPRLSMKHLSSAFVILTAGYLLSLSVFVAEKIIRFHGTMRGGIV